MNIKKLLDLKIIFFFIFLSYIPIILNYIFIRLKINNKILYCIILYLSIIFASIAVILAIVFFINLINKPIPRQNIGNINVYMQYGSSINPFIIIFRIVFYYTLISLGVSAILSLILLKPIYCGLGNNLELTVILLGALSTIVIEVVSGLITPRKLCPFKFIKSNEIKILESDEYVGGLTIETLNISRKSFFKSAIFIGKQGLSKELIETIKTHELAHAKEHHALIMQVFQFFLLSIIDIMAVIFYVSRTRFILLDIRNIFIIHIILFILNILFLTLLIFRIFEARADAQTFKIIGKKSYENLVYVLKLMYGEKVKSTKDAPIFSRLTHTSSREALKTGDPLSSISFVEFPLFFSFLSSTILLSFINKLSDIILFSLILPGLIVVVLLFGIVLRPIVKRYYNGTSKGATNFSFLLSGIYVTISISDLLVYPNIYFALLILLAGLTLAYTVTKAFIQSNALKTILLTFIIYEIINIMLTIIRFIHISVI